MNEALKHHLERAARSRMCGRPGPVGRNRVLLCTPAGATGDDTDLHDLIKPLIGLAFGASLISDFSRGWAAAFSPRAQNSARPGWRDVEARHAGRDPRNPAVIADNVGDDVGDYAGVGRPTCLKPAVVVTLIATMLLGTLLITRLGKKYAALYPLLLGGVSIITSIIGC